MDAGYLATHAVYQLVGFFFGHVALHAAQHMVADVLQGNIQIVADVLLLAHHSQ